MVEMHRTCAALGVDLMELDDCVWADIRVAAEELKKRIAYLESENRVLERALENQAEGSPGTQRGWAAKWKEQAHKELAKAGEEKQC